MVRRFDAVSVGGSFSAVYIRGSVAEGKASEH